MTADSVPAPMVQVPAALAELLDEWERKACKPRCLRINCSACNLGYAARMVRSAVVDAATPAASVPAADILALADEWEAAQRRCCGRKFPCTFHEWRGDDIADLRALVAAAEQADKGEAADTPREQTITEFQAGCPHLRYMTVTRNGLTKWVCQNCGTESLAEFPARVPVNDEAEACDKCNHWHEAQDRCGYCDCFPISHECDNGQANTCRHLSASGLDRTFGPGKVWRCDHCGLCWIEGYSPHDPRAARGEDA